MTTTPPSSIANRAQWAAWNGPEGAHWAEQEDAASEGLIEPLLDAAALTPTSLVLDIGCGTGTATRRAASRAPRGHALGVDLSELMIEQARRLTAMAGIPNADFVVDDAQTRPFDGGDVDVAISHFGVMFFADPVAAFANIGGALKPGGRLAFVCPQAMATCDWYTVPMGALLGERPTDEVAPSAMFSLADPDRVRAILTAAGFVDITMDPLHEPLLFGRDLGSAVDFFHGSGPVQALLAARPDIDDPRGRLERALLPYLTAEGVRVPGAHWLVTAHAGQPSNDAEARWSS